MLRTLSCQRLAVPLRAASLRLRERRFRSPVQQPRLHRLLPAALLQVPGIDSVSYGPTITGAHSPDERVQISTVLPFWEATVAILETLADRRPEQH